MDDNIPAGQASVQLGQLGPHGGLPSPAAPSPAGSKHLATPPKATRSKKQRTSFSSASDVASNIDFASNIDVAEHIDVAEYIGVAEPEDEELCQWRKRLSAALTNPRGLDIGRFQDPEAVTKRVKNRIEPATIKDEKTGEDMESFICIFDDRYYHVEDNCRVVEAARKGPLFPRDVSIQLLQELVNDTMTAISGLARLLPRTASLIERIIPVAFSTRTL